MSMDILSPMGRQMSAVLDSIRAESTHALQDCELRAPQAHYIVMLCQHPGLTQDALAQRLGVNRSNVTRQLADLEANGFVERTRNSTDRREWHVTPTDRAYEVLPRLVELRNDCQAMLFRGLSPEEQELFCELLARIAHNAERRVARLHEQD